MLLGRSRILYVGPGTLRIAFRRVPRAPMTPHRLLGGCQSCSQTLATLPTCMPWGWVGLEATAELPVSSEEAHTVCEMSTDIFSFWVTELSLPIVVLQRLPTWLGGIPIVTTHPGKDHRALDPLRYALRLLQYAPRRSCGASSELHFGRCRERE